MLLFIDNYDSFTWNLVHYLGELGAESLVRRNDQISIQEAFDLKPQAIILSPGPRDPARAGICLDLIRHAPLTMPILGICLGHQAIGEAFGGKITRALLPMHGKVSCIQHDGEGLFRGVPQGFQATRYHSLTVDEKSLPSDLKATARSEDGLIMALSHRSRPIHGLQFHPESIASEWGHAMLANFLKLAGINVKSHPRLQDGRAA